MGYITTEKLQSFANKFAEKVTSLFVEKETDKGLSTNDYTTSEKDKLAGIADGAQVNVIESIFINGVVVPVSEKGVNLDVLVAADLANYYTATQVDQKLSAIPKFSIEVVQILPTEDISSTTVYLVPAGSEDQNLYVEYIYAGGKWEKLGAQSVDLSGYLTKAAGITNVLPKSATVITFTRGDGTTFDVTVTGTTYGNATTSNAGLMSAADKVKLDGMSEITEAEIDAIVAGTFGG